MIEHDTIKPRFLCTFCDKSIKFNGHGLYLCCGNAFIERDILKQYHVNFSPRHGCNSMTFRAKRVDLDIMIGQRVDDNIFIKLLLARKVSIIYITRNDINEVLVITDKDDKQLNDC